MTDRPASPSSHPLTAAGFVFALLGMGTTAYAFLASGAPDSSRTLNLGLLNDKLILAVAGSALFLGGLFLSVMGSVLNHLAQLSRIGYAAPVAASPPADQPPPPPVAEPPSPEPLPAARPIMDPPPPPGPAPMTDRQPGDDVRPGGARGRHWRQHQ